MSREGAAGRVAAAPLAAHLVSLAGAFAFWAWLDRNLWFFGDDWEFLVKRGLGYSPASRHGPWFPHNEHWSTLPILLWRALFSIWHLGSYWPYLAPLLFAQIGIMHLLWRLSLRHGAGPWVATASVALLGFLGAGAEDLAWAFQVGFVGSLLFGLVAFDVVDAGATSRARQGQAAVALVASVMCSTVGDALWAGAAVLCFSKLPRRQALAVVLPAATAYALWFGAIGHLGLGAHSDRFPLASFTGLPGYAWDGVSSALGQVFNLQAAGTALLLGLLGWVGWHFRQLWAEDAALVALAFSVWAFYGLAALGRDASTVSPAVSRYVYIAFALLVPLVAKILSSVGTSTGAVAGAVTLLVFTLLGNVNQAQDWVKARQALTSLVSVQLHATAKLLLEGARAVGGASTAPVSFSPNLSVGDIARLAASGELPSRPVPPVDLVNARAVLAVGYWDGLSMSLGGRPVSSGRFRLLGVSDGSARPAAGGCASLLPLYPGRPARVTLGFAHASQATASVKLSVPAPQATSAERVGVFLVPPDPPASSVPVELAVPASGTGYLNDNFNGADLVLTWDGPAPLRACGLA